MCVVMDDGVWLRRHVRVSDMQHIKRNAVRLQFYLISISSLFFFPIFKTLLYLFHILFLFCYYN